MAVIKRTKENSVSDLTGALEEFVGLLEGQKEQEAADDLRTAASDLEKHAIGSKEFLAVIAIVIDAFEGDHELSAYTLRRKDADDGNWTVADQLYHSSTKVFNLAQRLRG